MNIRSDHVLLEWDGITAKRDYQSIFDWNKKLYIIPHHEGRVAGYYATPEDERIIRAKITKYSTKVIFELQTLRNLWKEFECDKFVLIYPPTRTGIKTKKEKARKILGIKTKYVIIAWGEYTSGKHYGDILLWIKEWGDTSLLFCGSGEHIEKKSLQDKVIELGLQDRVFFSEHGISDEDADLWFSASDLCSCPRTYFGTATPIYVIGQGKVIVLPKNTTWFEYGGYEELEKISGVVVSEDIKKTTRDLLLDGKKRMNLEMKSIQYAKNNSFEKYARKIMKVMR
jgi:glycosyltransferase involved in cell wall biosynthesis